MTLYAYTWWDDHSQANEHIHLISPCVCWNHLTSSLPKKLTEVSFLQLSQQPALIPLVSSTFIHHCYITTSFPIQGKDSRGPCLCFPGRPHNIPSGRQSAKHTCCCSVAKSCLTLCDLMACSTPVFPVLHYVPEFAQIHIQWFCDAILSSYPLPPLILLPSVFPSIRVFSNESVLCIRWPKYGGFSLSNSPSNEYSGLISFRIDWLDLLAVQGTLISLL